MARGSGNLTLRAVGDLLISDPDPTRLFEKSSAGLHAGDITFGNCEFPYAERNPAMPAVFREHGFDVMSFANNHVLDAGQGAFLGTIDLLRESGIEPVGAGKDIASAREPVIIDRNGVRVAFLGYSSIGVPSYAAGVDRPGCAPMQAHTGYEQLFDNEDPGGPAKIITSPRTEDLHALCADVRAAKERADLVAISLHWGPLLMRWDLADYQFVVGKAAIDNGADMILGHHPHILKGVDMYRGKPIFYSMGHFICKTAIHPAIRGQTSGGAPARNGPVTDGHVRKMLKAYRGEFGLFDGYPDYNFGPETRNTMIVDIEIRDKQIARVSYLPYFIEPDCQAVPLHRDDPRFADHLAFMREATQGEDLGAELGVEGNEIVVTAREGR